MCSEIRPRDTRFHKITMSCWGIFRSTAHKKMGPEMKPPAGFQNRKRKKKRERRGKKEKPITKFVANAGRQLRNQKARLPWAKNHNNGQSDKASEKTFPLQTLCSEITPIASTLRQSYLPRRSIPGAVGESQGKCIRMLVGNWKP